MSEPGLIRREFFMENGAQKILEEWDVTVPGCPMLAMTVTWPWRRDERVKTVTQIRTLPSGVASSSVWPPVKLF